MLSYFLRLRVRKRRKTSEEKYSPPDSGPFDSVEFGKISLASQANSPRGRTAEFEFNKSGKHFIRTHNEALTVVAMRIHNPDCSPVGINR